MRKWPGSLCPPLFASPRNIWGVEGLLGEVMFENLGAFFLPPQGSAASSPKTAVCRQGALCQRCPVPLKETVPTVLGVAQVWTLLERGYALFSRVWGFPTVRNLEIQNSLWERSRGVSGFVPDFTPEMVNCSRGTSNCERQDSEEPTSRCRSWFSRCSFPLRSRLSFPATEPPDLRRVSEGF